MKKLNLVIGILIGIMILSCSNDDDRAQVAENELIGISSFFESQGDFKFSAPACEELDAIRIEPDKFKELLSANPAFGIKIINMLCERIKMTNERLRNVLNQSSKSRLISEIVSISKRTSSLKIEISTDELSQLIVI